MTDLDAAAVAEIEELHVEFERWFSGESDSLDRVEQVLADDFTMVPPSGETVHRADLMAGLQKAQGAVQLSIEIRSPVVRWQGVDGLLGELRGMAANRRQLERSTVNSPLRLGRAGAQRHQMGPRARNLAAGQLTRSQLTLVAHRPRFSRGGAQLTVLWNLDISHGPASTGS